jgi:putative DNA primase/helicase
VNERHVTAWNWQTGESVTVGMGDEASSRAERRHIAAQADAARAKREERARQAVSIANDLVEAAQSARHPYLSGKGFNDEMTLVVDAEYVLERAGGYLVPEGGKKAIVMPARIGNRITSAQLIWEDGTKKFLAGGTITGASHRIAKGGDTWLCEGLATGLTLRAALKSMHRSDTVLCCFSAGNVAKVAGAIKRRCLIVTDNDKPQEQFGGLGTGEHWARTTGKPYVMPPKIKTDLNDVQMRHGIFAAQKLIAGFLRTVKV